jgi:hypothetical protein
MTEESQQKEVVLGKSEGVKEDPSYLILKGGVAVHGTHLVSQKIIAVLSELLKLDTKGECFGVCSVVFRNDGMPKGMLGMAYPDTGSIAINLEEIWVLSTMILEEGEKHLSLTGLIWENLLMTLFHETNHIDGCRDVEFRENMEKDHKAADEHAEDWAKDIRKDMALKYDIEPPAMADMPYFGAKFMELMTTKAEEEWVSNAAALVQEGIIYQDLKNDEQLTTYREYVRGLVDPKLEDTDWDQGYSAIDLVFNLEDGGEKVIEEAKVEVKEPEIVEAAPQVLEAAEPTVVETAEPTVIAVDVAESAELAAVGAAQEESAQLGEAGATVVADEGTTVVPEQQQLFASVGVADEQAEADADYNAVMGAEAEQSFTDTVNLPPEILAEQEQMAAAANATPEQFQPKTPLTPVNMTPDQIVAFMKDVYQRLYSNIFNKCKGIRDNDQPFESPAAVLDPISLADLVQYHNAQGLISYYETKGATGGRAFEDFEGHVRGTVFAKSNPYGIPAYILYLNLGGVATKRSLVPQNPAKRNAAGQLSSTALEARNGHAICWIMSDGPNKFIAQIRDNVYTVL